MIDGNTTVRIETKTTSKNSIGESVIAWEDAMSIFGWLDLMNGDSRYTTYDAKIQESSHIFISDYVNIPKTIKPENSRLVDEDGLIYDIMMIDDPMKLHRQLEIYLKYTGSQVND